MQLGSLDWAEATSGRLSSAERRAFLAPAARQALVYATGRLRLALGLRRADAVGLDVDGFALPDSKLVREAEAEAREQVSPAVLQHSYRTFFFGLALARLDGVDVDAEQLYATSLLHDLLLESPSEAACFAVRSAHSMQQLARRAGLDEPTARRLAEAIAHHITPGLGLELGPLPLLLQLGAMVDLTGQRLWDLRPEFVEATLRRHPRLGMKQVLASAWQAEARGFPEGRAAFIERVFRFALLVRLAPFSE